MWSRVLFSSVALFFVVMNVLLFRSEFGGRNEIRSTIPAELVLRKILTSPDNSFLEIRHHGQKIGTCQLTPSVGQEVATGKVGSEDLPPEGMLEDMTYYTLDLNGNLNLDEFSRWRFSFDVKLSTNLLWQDFFLRLNKRPTSFEVRSSSPAQTVHFRADGAAFPFDHTYSFEELRHPDKILGDLGTPLLGSILNPFGISLDQTDFGAGGLSMKWDAREDKLKVGGSFMRVYRLQTRLLNHFPVLIYVSRVGEILRIELPDEIVIANDVLLNL